MTDEADVEVYVRVHRVHRIAWLVVVGIVAFAAGLAVGLILAR